MTSSKAPGPVFRKGDRVRVINNSEDPRCYAVGDTGTVMGCGMHAGAPIPRGGYGRIGIQFDPGIYPPCGRGNGNADLGNDGGNVVSGYRWTVPMYCLELVGPLDYTQVDEGGVV